ncbi:MAG: glycosyltransferase family 9 protein [Planctomycetes bacterium]|nr:glycosyltransferase family 9 protein [Planctomycetota bacterium]
MNILVHQAALGDFVLTFPLLQSLAADGGATLVVAHGSKARLAARLFPHVQPIDIESPGWSALHASDAALPPALFPFIRDIRRVISFISRGDDAWSANTCRLLPHAQHFFIDPRPPQGSRIHVTQWHREQLIEQNLILPPAARGLASAPRSSSFPLLLHPGSGGRTKCWPRENFESLITALRDQQIPVQPILGEAELDTWPRTAIDRWQHDLHATAVTTLDQLCDIFMTARAYIGNDSGPTHLAAQLGLPTLVLFGPTDSAVWSPLGPRVRLLAPPTPRDMTWLAPAAALAATLSLLSESSPSQAR